MKFNFKKVAAVTASMLATVGLTAGVASAVQYPDNWSSSNVAVVYGNDLDSAVATNINEDIDDSISFESSGSSASVGEESVLIEDGEVYLGEDLSDTFDDRDFEDLLAEQTLVDDEDDISDIDYATEIAVDNSGVEFSDLDEDEYYVHSDKAEDEIPVLNIDLSNGDVYSVETDFYSDVNFTDYVDSETITIAGKELVINPNTDDESENVLSFYESSETVTIESGDSKTVDGKEIEVTGGVIDDQTANFVIDGKAYSGLATGDEKDGVYVKDVAASDVGDTSTLQVEVMVGSAEWKIEDDEIEIDDETIDGVSVDWSEKHQEVGYINFDVNPSDMDEDYLEELLGIDADDDPEDKVQKLEIGGEFIDPLFNFGMFFEGSEPEVGEGDPDLEFSAASDLLTIDFTNRNGVEHSITPYEYDDSDKVNVSENWFVSTNTTDAVLQGLQEDDIFIVSSDTDEDEVTFIYQVDDLDEGDEGESDEITLVDAAGDGSSRTYREGDEIEDSGLNISAIYDDGNKFDITDMENGELASVQNEIITNGEVSVSLSGLDNVDGNKEIGETSTITLQEDTDEELDENGDSPLDPMEVTITADSNDEELQITSVDYTDAAQDGISNSETDIEYSVSKLGTYTELDTDDKASFDVWSPEDQQVEYQVSVADLEASEDGSSDGEAGTKAISADEGYSDNDVVIAVGGSCINSAAAEALGVSEETCGSDFTDATGVGSGEFLIQKVSDAYDSGATAIVVAGYEASDTEAAGNTFIDEDVELSEDGQVYETATKEVVTAE